jgi:hypothetical protein
VEHFVSGHPDSTLHNYKCSRILHSSMNFYLDRTAPKSSCGSSLTTSPPLPAALGTMLLNATLSALGALSISLGGGSDPSVPWLQGGGVAFRDHAVWYASDCEQTTASRCAPLLPEMGSTVPRSGTDSIGTYTEASVDYVTAKGAKPKFVTGVRSYADAPDVAVLTQYFPDGLSPMNKQGETTEIVSAFPTLKRSMLDLGVILYEGVQCQNSRFFRWLSGTAFGADDPGEENAFFRHHFCTKNDQSSKTGSGQTSGNTGQRGGVSCFAPRCERRQEGGR